ncbi:MAG: exosortase/archaeosortase family protein [Limisphaerales bacterium]
MSRYSIHLPWLAVVAWWLWDLHAHWEAQVEFQHGWLVAPLAAYLAWERLPTSPPPAPPQSIRGPLFLALLSAPLVLFSELYKNAIASTPFSSFVLSVGCCGFVLAILWAQHGRPVARHFLFPLLFVFVAVPIPKLIWNPIVLGLQGFITTLNVETLNLLGIPALRTGNLIHLPRGTVGVDEACSGIRSLQSSIMAALFISDLTLKRTGAKVFFFIAGVALAVAGNFGRSLFLSLTAANRGIQAVDGVHDTAGWSVLLFTAAGIGTLAWWVARTEKRLAAEIRSKSPA